MKQTMGDVLVGTDSNKFFYNSGPSKPLTQEQTKALLPNLDGFDRTSTGMVIYNESLPHFDPLYANLKPLYGVLVRTFVRAEFYTKTGIYKGSDVAVNEHVEIRMKDHQAYIKDHKDSPFKFQLKCVVISAPETDETFKPGKVFSYKPVKNFAPDPRDPSKIMYEYAYIHPDAGLVVPPTDPTDRHYGYLLLPRQMFNVELPDQHFTEIKEEYLDLKTLNDEVWDKSKTSDKES